MWSCTVQEHVKGVEHIFLTVFSPAIYKIFVPLGSIAVPPKAKNCQNVKMPIQKFQRKKQNCSDIRSSWLHPESRPWLPHGVSSPPARTAPFLHFLLFKTAGEEPQCICIYVLHYSQFFSVVEKCWLVIGFQDSRSSEINLLSNMYIFFP